MSELDVQYLSGNGVDHFWATARAQIHRGLELLSERLEPGFSAHTHSADDIVSGVIDTARIPWSTPGSVISANASFDDLNVEKSSGDVTFTIESVAETTRTIALRSDFNTRWIFG